MNEKKLAEKLKNGGAKALGGVIDAYSGYVRTVARNFSRGALTAEDIDEVTADVFYKLYKRRGELVDSAGLRPYLSAITKNAVKNRFRQSGQYELLPEDILEETGGEASSVEDAAEQSEMMRCLAEGMAGLPEDDREIFIRFYFYGERSAAIAGKLGISESLVNTRLHRVRGRLKKFLNERGHYHV